IHARIGDQRLSRRCTAMDDLDETARDPRIKEQLDQPMHNQGALLWRLDHDGIAGSKGRPELVTCQVERRVEWRDGADHADWKAHQEGHLAVSHGAAIEGDVTAFDAD